MGITPDSGKATHVYASRGVSERIAAGRAGQGKHTCSARHGMGPRKKVTSGGSSEVQMGRVVRGVKVAVPVRTGRNSGLDGWEVQGEGGRRYMAQSSMRGRSRQRAKSRKGACEGLQGGGGGPVRA